MKRCLGWSLLLTTGILLGMAMSPFQATRADSPADEAASAKSAAGGETVATLKEIRDQLKDINSHLHTGVTKVFVMMNPPPGQNP